MTKPRLTRGQRVIRFIEQHCRVPEGDLVGQRIVLDEFEKKFILEVYDNPYGTRRAYLSIAKKNGKTTLIACLVLVHLVGPEARYNSQIVSGGMSKPQAALVFNAAKKMIELSDELTQRIHVKPSAKVLRGLLMNVEYAALAREGKTTQGVSPIVAILDEVGQVEGPRDDFVSAVVTSQEAYDDALLIAISTQAQTDLDLFSTWLDAQATAPDPRTVSHVYEAPKGCALDDRRAWAAANPALGKYRSMKNMEHAAMLARQLPSNESEFRNFHLNQRVIVTNPFVTREVWEKNGAAPKDLKGRKVYAGLDLASVNDLCALVIATEDGDVESHFWLPKEGLKERSKKDRVPYDVWAKDGLLHLTPGAAVEYEHVASFLRGVFDRLEVVQLGFDRYNMKFLKPWLKKEGFTDGELKKFIEFGQGTQSMTPALRSLEVKLLQGKYRHGNHPVLSMCARNAITVGDSGARKFDKTRARGRIDGMVALAMAEGVMPQTSEKKYQMLFV